LVFVCDYFLHIFKLYTYLYCIENNVKIMLLHILRCLYEKDSANRFGFDNAYPCYGPVGAGFGRKAAGLGGKAAVVARYAPDGAVGPRRGGGDG
jgi:hypothetical protein